MSEALANRRLLLGSAGLVLFLAYRFLAMAAAILLLLAAVVRALPAPKRGLPREEPKEQELQRRKSLGVKMKTKDKAQTGQRGGETLRARAPRTPKGETRKV